MKKGTVIIAVVLVVLCVVGWITVGTQVVSEVSSNNNLVEQADEWVERGLYQRAIGNYEEALKEDSSEDIYLKMNIAYSLRFEEEPSKTFDDYFNFLGDAVNAYPGNKTLVDKYIELCKLDENMKVAYGCLKNAIAAGYDTKENREMLLKIQYSFTLSGGEFGDIIDSQGKYYTVSNKLGWNLYSSEDGYVFDDTHEYVGPVDESGKCVVTDEDSRIMDPDYMVWGIFDDIVTESKMMSEGLIAACCNGKYSFYNDFGDKQFGDYEMAGTFQNGYAPVMQNGAWYFVDAKGEIKSDKFDEIVTDSVGRYLVNERFIAKSGGKYGIYNSEMKLETPLDCTDTDILTQDGILAVCKGSKWGFVDLNGKEIIKPQYAQAKSFSNTLAAVFDGEKWGFITKDGIVVIEYQFADAEYMNASGVCPVEVYIDNEDDETEDVADDTVSDTEADTQPAEALQDSTEVAVAVEFMKNWKMLKLVMGIVE